MKLDKKTVVQRRIGQMVAEGVTFMTNTEVGVNYPARKLMDEFDALVLCTGATQPRDLPIEGRKLQGIHFAMDFLTANTKAVLDGHKNGNFINAQGKEVIVIGGGDTGTDCVGTSMRHGCRSVVQLEILPKPPTERAADNPWPEWPKVYRMDYGQEEAAAVFGDDPRRYLTTAKRVRKRRPGAGQNRPHRRDRLGERCARTLCSPGGCRDRAGPPRATCPPGHGLPWTGAAVARTTGRRA